MNGASEKDEVRDGTFMVCARGGKIMINGVVWISFSWQFADNARIVDRRSPDETLKKGIKVNCSPFNVSPHLFARIHVIIIILMIIIVN